MIFGGTPTHGGQRGKVAEVGLPAVPGQCGGRGMPLGLKVAANRSSADLSGHRGAGSEMLMEPSERND